MKTHEYGYWISETPAAEHPQTARHMHRFTPSNNAWVAVGICAALFLFAWFDTRNFDTDLSPLGTFFGIAAIIGSMIATVMVIEEVHKRRLHRLLRGNPWQAWPIRMDKRHEFHILDPDQKPVATLGGFAEQIPDAVRASTTDGAGVLWVCGDLQGNVVVSLVGGDAPIFLARTRSPRSTLATSAVQEAAIATAIYTAGAAATNVFLSLDG